MHNLSNTRKHTNPMNRKIETKNKNFKICFNTFYQTVIDYSINDMIFFLSIYVETAMRLVKNQMRNIFRNLLKLKYSELKRSASKQNCRQA